MPLRDYKCDYCDCVVIDKLEPMSAEAEQDCPICKREKALKRLLTAPSAINFVGTGWYKPGFTHTTHDFVKNPSNTTP